MLVGLYAGLYVVLALAMPMGFIVNGLMDDSFYYLEVARNVAAGLGSTFDGVEPTNGYHPLWLLILTPIFAVFPGDEAPLRFALVVSAVLGIGMLLFARRILLNTVGAWGAALGLILFAWPRFFGQTLNLLETSLLLFFYFWFLAVWTGDGEDSRSRSQWAQDFGWGVLLGFTCLARLDTVFLLLSLGLFALRATWRGESLWRTGELASGSVLTRLALNVRPLFVAVLVVAPYLLWNLVHFGHLQPVSGSMKTTFPRPGLTLRYLGEFPEFALLCLVGLVFLGIWLKRSSRGTRGELVSSLTPDESGGARNRVRKDRLVQGLAIFGLAGFFHMTYTLLFMCWGVDRWHFGVLIPMAILGLPLAADEILSRAPSRMARTLRGGMLVIGSIAAAIVLGYSLKLRDGRYLDVTRHLAYWARTHLPEDAVIATTDAGVMAYFSHRTTVNLDGLINNFRYRDYLRAGRLLDYLDERGVGYILDQYQAQVPEWVAGTYDTRPYRVWFRPEKRLGGEIVLYREDEVARINTNSRLTLGSSDRVDNAVVLWRYRSQR